MKLNILAFAAHPDDVELAASGTMATHLAQGYKAGIVDLTRGELGTRGTAELRAQEAARATEILGIHVRENLGMRDGFFSVDETHSMSVIEAIRAYQPEIVLCNAVTDRHIDHGRAAKLVAEACFLSGLRKIETQRHGKKQDAWRPKAVYHSGLLHQARYHCRHHTLFRNQNEKHSGLFIAVLYPRHTGARNAHIR
jgi:bacillithiol biosynthesis deacetylase BshB1